MTVKLKEKRSLLWGSTAARVACGYKLKSKSGKNILKTRKIISYWKTSLNKFSTFYATFGLFSSQLLYYKVKQLGERFLYFLKLPFITVEVVKMHENE